MASPPPTLYEDWQARRRRLFETPGPAGSPYRDVQVKVLDYLLGRYAGDAAAARPARFPLHTDVVWKQRTLVVHRHLRAKDHEVVRDAPQAQARASRILDRIAAQAPQADTQVPGGGAVGAGDAARFLVHSVTEGIPQTLKGVADLGHWFRGEESQRNETLKRFRNLERDRQQDLLRGWFEILEQRALNIELASRGGLGLGEDGDLALWFLTHCGHPDAHGYLMLLWKEYVRLRCHQDWVERVEQILKAPEFREETAEAVRAELASAASTVRLRALHLLPELGGLDDIGLLHDLLALPVQEDEAPGERDAELTALRRLAGEDRAGESSTPLTTDH